MAISSEKAVRSYLTEFGLNDKEVVIYLTLLKTGPSTIMDLSRKTGIKRSTTHNNVEELIKKGLVSQTNYGERRMAVAEDPEKLKFLLEQRKWDVNKLEKIMPDIVKSIYEIVPGAKENSKVEVKYYEGEKGVRLVYREVVKSTELRSYVNISKIFELFPENPQLFPENLDKGKIHMWELIEDSEISREYVKNLDHDKYRYKFFPKTWNMDVFDYMIFDDKIAIISSDKLNNVTCVLIQSKGIAENAKFLFDLTWDSIA